ncbi:MAG TPA: hypothetical protein ENK66_06465 [Arcobacter sp.]|jgi:hypothetical protein|nr:hypothetical protein [Arcobacter sp.]
MVFDPIALKSEALLLFTRDLIETYENKNEIVFDVDKTIGEFVDFHIQNLKKGINSFVQENSYYLRNRNISRIKMILHYYSLLQKQVENQLNKNDKFDPCMLSFSMLAIWFKELGIESKVKELIFFAIYPYGDVYDKLLVDNYNDEYKKINIKMINLSEKIIMKFYKEK